MRLDEHNRAFGIEARRVQADGHVDGPLGEARGVVGLCDGVQVHDREQTIMLVLQLDPILDGAEVVADVQLARGLDAGKDARHGVTTYDCGGRPRKVRELKDLVDVAKVAAERAGTLLRQCTPSAETSSTGARPGSAPGRASGGCTSPDSPSLGTRWSAPGSHSRVFRCCGATSISSPP